MMIVAEIGGNHRGSYGRAKHLIEAARAAGADAVKFQCFTPEQMADAGTVIKDGPWKGRELLDLYHEIHTPREWFPTLFDFSRKAGLIPFSSVFHPDDVDFLETLNCPIYKISSFELTDHALILSAARTNKQLIISTGMASQNEIGEARFYAGYSPILLKCVSAYPSAVSDANLAAMVEMRRVFNVDVGLSDHSLSNIPPVVAATLGALVIEKHLILDRQDGGPDAHFSLEPHEFERMVADVMDAISAVGSGEIGPMASELASYQFRRQSGGKRG